MFTLVALVVAHVSVVGWPARIVEGFAVNVVICGGTGCTT